MVRIIKTEFYFSPDQQSLASATQNESGNFSFCVGFIGLDGGSHPSLDRLTSILDSRSLIQADVISNEEMKTFIGIALENPKVGSDFLFRPPYQDRFFSLAAKSVLDSDVVVERSPPSHVKLKDLVKKSSGTVVGISVGVGLSGGSYPLMLVTIPMGILIMGSAIGVATGLENGLSRAVARMIDKQLR